MAESLVVQIAEAVLETLQAATLSRSFEARRAYVPVYELKDLTALRVTVVPASAETEILDRTPRSQGDYEISLGIQQRVASAEPTALDALMGFVQEVVDLFQGQPLEGGIPARCTSAANTPIFVPQHLDEKRVFTSVVNLTFRLVR